MDIGYYSNFILTVSSQLKFLNYWIQVYFPYRDLSPHRPFLISFHRVSNLIEIKTLSSLVN